MGGEDAGHHVVVVDQPQNRVRFLAMPIGTEGFEFVDLTDQGD